MRRELLSLIVILSVLLAGLMGTAILVPMLHSPEPSSPTLNTTLPPQPTTSAPPPTTLPPTEPTQPPIVKEQTVRLTATGDMLMHMSVVNSVRSGKDYDFYSLFRFLTPYVQEADLAFCNLETTLAGLDNGYSYSNYPCFNTPDVLIRDLREVGFDTILTANNHSYDTRSVGFHRTQKVIRDYGLSVLGTRETEDDPVFSVVEQGGIRMGLVCYTYEYDDPKTDPARKYLNGIPVSVADGPLVNSFHYYRLDKFYAEVAEIFQQMRRQGVDTIVFFIHWGDEYSIRSNSRQAAIAQELCDLGVDVIIGGHAHVVQPMELFRSTIDESHKTVCLYSMGNTIANQRRDNMNLKTGHTEDGMLFSLNYARYSDGSIILESVEILPTWVRKQLIANKPVYTVLPLDKNLEDWKEAFSLSNTHLTLAKGSYDRTMKIVGDGLEEVNAYLSRAQTELELALGILPPEEPPAPTAPAPSEPASTDPVPTETA